MLSSRRQLDVQEVAHVGAAGGGSAGDHVSAVLGQAYRVATALPSGCARDQGDLAVEPSRHENLAFLVTGSAASSCWNGMANGRFCRRRDVYLCAWG